MQPYSDVRDCEKCKNREKSKDISINDFYFMGFDMIGKKEFICKSLNCNKKFTRLSFNAKMHFKRHLDLDLPYICNICFMGFHRFSDLKRHNTIDHLSKFNLTF